MARCFSVKVGGEVAFVPKVATISIWSYAQGKCRRIVATPRLESKLRSG